MYLQWNTNISKANVLILDFYSLTNDQKAQALTFLAQFAFWRAAFSVTYAVEFLCLSVAKLMVLDRMSGFLSRDRQRIDGSSRRWAVGGRVVVAAVVAGNLVGLAGNVAAAVQWQPTVELWTNASAEWTVNNTDAADSYGKDGLVYNQRAISTLSIQAFSEAAVLLLIVAAFSVVGIACVRRIGFFLSAQRLGAAAAAAAEADGRQLQRQIVATSAVVFVTFFVRSVYSTMYALAVGLQNYNSCPGKTNLCDACYNVFAQMEIWMKRTPEFVLMIVLTTKPLPLLVALWGMTSNRLLTKMRPNQRELAGGDSLLKGQIPSRRSSM